MQRIFTSICAFFREERGSVFPLVAGGLLTMVIAAGAAVDMGRASIVQARLTQALDAAGLAAGADVSTANINSEVQKYMTVNFPTGYMGTTLTSLTVVPNADSTVLSLAATATMDTTLLQVVGIDSIDIDAESEITREAKGLELVLVTDVTGSMNNNNKLNDMKSAAAELLNILYGDGNDTVDNLWVGLVPFAQAVNVGSSRTSWVSGTFNWGTTSWMGCVDARETNNRDITDDPPSVEVFPRYYWPCHTSYNAWYGTNSSRNNCSTSGTIRYKSGLGTSLGPNKNCSPAITPLTSSKTTVVNAINALTATGNTHVNIGAAWGWRMLSPRWRGLWGGEMDANNLPLDYNTPLMNKAIVLLTDGDNTMSNSVHTAYWYLSDGRLGTTSQSGAESQLDTRLSQVCSAMKGEGIVVYTIGFGNPGSTISNLLRDCASRPEYYFDSPTGADLMNAFRQIGDSLANLRISK